MSPNDAAFLKSLGIKPEEIEIARNVVQFGTPGVWAYERCPKCDGMRHRFIEDGYVFCLSCSAREQREKRYQAALRRANNPDRLFIKTVEMTYRGFEIAHLDGVGWCYRCPAVEIFRYWMRANSFEDAQRRVDRIATVESKEYDEPIEPLNRCRDCDAPCGHLRYCGPCGKAHYL